MRSLFFKIFIQALLINSAIKMGYTVKHIDTNKYEFMKEHTSDDTLDLHDWFETLIKQTPAPAFDRKGVL